MRIGVDFDGVIADPTREKILFAKKYFGVDLCPEDCTTRRAEKIVGSGYAELLIPSLEWGPLIPHFDPTPHCAQALSYLQHQGHQVVIITTLSTEQGKMDWAKHFLNKNGIPYAHWTSLSTGIKDRVSKDYGYKRYMCEKLGMNALIDDDIRNLEPMNGSGRLLLLFDQPWNRDVSIGGSIQRAHGWRDVIDKVMAYQNQWAQRKAA